MYLKAVQVRFTLFFLVSGIVSRPLSEHFLEKLAEIQGFKEFLWEGLSCS